MGYIEEVEFVTIIARVAKIEERLTGDGCRLGLVALQLK